MEVGSTLKFAWKIKNLSNLQEKAIYLDVFSLGSYKWRMLACPKGDDGIADHLGVYLCVANSKTLPFGWSRIVKFSFTVIDQINEKSSRKFGETDRTHIFDAKRKCWGYNTVIPLSELHDPKKGYLVKDSCIIEAEVTICEDVSVESRGTIKETSKKEPTEEDMDAFFVDLNSVIFPKKVVSSEEEAKQALAIIEEALNMAPADLRNPGRMSQLINAFDVLSSLDDCSVLTSEQKAELLSMKDKFIGLPGRAASAVKGIKSFTERELFKNTLDKKLGKCLVGFEKAKAEIAQNEQNIATLQGQVDSLLAQIGEMKKKKENSLVKRKEMFKLSKELKEELDVILKNWPLYEAQMKVDEEEEKVVGTEWSKMKQFVSSLKPQSMLAPKSVKRKRSTRSSRIEKGFPLEEDLLTIEEVLNMAPAD